MSSAIVPKSAKARQLDRPSEPDEQFTEEQAKDPERLSRTIVQLLRDVASLKRRFVPRRVDFEDIEVDATGTTIYRFVHRFGGRVRWWVVDWNSSSAGPALAKDASSDENTLKLVSGVAGTLTLRVEEAG